MKYLIFIVFLINTQFLNAQTFEPPVIIDPPHPMVGDTIRVGIYTEFYPPCLILPWQNFQGQTHLFESSGNHFDLTVVARTLPICNPLPIIAPREYYELGQLSEGTYSLQVYGIDETTPLPVPITNPQIYFPYEFGGTVIFEVYKPLVVNTFSKTGLLFLIMMLLIFTLFFYKKLPT